MVAPDAINPENSSFYWVNQKRDEEIEGEFLQAPVDNFTHHNLDRLDEGDVIFHYTTGGIFGISAVTKTAQKIEIEGDEHYRVPVDLNRLENDIPLNQIVDTLQKEEFKLDENYPINVEGRVNQGYLFRLSGKAGKYLLEAVQEGPKNPNFYRATGWPDHWLTGYRRDVWGLDEGNESFWERVSPGDIVFFHATQKDSHDNSHGAGLIGYGIVGSKEEKDEQWWRKEHEEDENLWPYIVHFRETHWTGDTRRISDRDITEKTSEEIEEEIDALIENRVTFSEIGDTTGYSFPTMGSASSVDHGPEILEMVREKTSYFADQEPYGVDIDIDSDVDATVTEDVIEDGLYFPGDQAEELAGQVQAALNSGKHIIFTGPPGTGKTEIARQVANHLAEEHDDLYTGKELTTATSDWSTFDTVGGYMPEQSGESDRLVFRAGHVLKRFRDGREQRNDILIIDEINRADIDKAFGQLFTLLSGQKVTLPFEEENGEEVEIWPADHEEAPVSPSAHQYIRPESWRIFATMNTYDKTSLYEMSYAFMRRFAFIQVDVPDNAHEHLDDYIETWGMDVDQETREAVSRVWQTMNVTGEQRKIGPALVKDMLGFMEHSDRDVQTALTQAIINYIYPQLEGVRNNEQIVRELFTTDADRDRLQQVAEDMLRADFDEEE